MHAKHTVGHLSKVPYLSGDMVEIEIGKLKVGPKRVLLELNVEEQVTEGGILLPDSVKIGTYTAKVLKVGKGVVDVVPGDMVVYSGEAHSPQILKKYSVFKMENILGIIVEEDLEDE